MEEQKETNPNHETVNSTSKKQVQNQNGGDGGDNFPTELDTSRHAYFVSVAKDKLTARYIGKGNHISDVGSVRSNHPTPSHQKYFYYEVFIVSAGEQGAITVGLADNRFPLNRQPGHENSSYGYRGDSGKIYGGHSRGKEYGPAFSTGDTVGCGIKFDCQEIFFTLNGKNLGMAFDDVHKTLYPTVGLHSPGEVVKFNFGQSAFSFDLEAFEEEEKRKLQTSLDEIKICNAMMQELVKDYLLHQGYEQTLQSLEKSCVTSSPAPPKPKRPAPSPPSDQSKPQDMNIDNILELLPPPPTTVDMDGKAEQIMQIEDNMEGNGAHSVEVCSEDGEKEEKEDKEEAKEGLTQLQMEVDIQEIVHQHQTEESLKKSISTRALIREKILQGCPAEATALVIQFYPGLLEKHPTVKFDLCCWEFGCLVQKKDFLAAVSFAREKLAPFQQNPETKEVEGSMETDIFEEKLKRVMGLLAYGNTEESPVSNLILKTEAQRVADVVNDAILASINQNEAKHNYKSALQYVLSTLVAVQEVRREVAGNKGECFRLPPSTSEEQSVQNTFMSAAEHDLSNGQEDQTMT